MKFLAPLTLFVAAGVSAAGPKCQADNIVTTCLGSENKKVGECRPEDYDCLCAAYQAVQTCYNNCPNDDRAASAKNQADSFCQNASLYGSKALASKTASRSSSSSGSAATATGSDSESATATATGSGNRKAASSTGTSSSSQATSTGAADIMSANAPGLLLVVAGAVAALL